MFKQNKHMADFIAIKVVKGKVLKQRFSDYSWNLLGTDKNGWVRTEPQTIHNTIESQKITTSGKDQVISNSVSKKNEPVIVNTIDEPTVSGKQKVEDSKKLEFMESLEGLSKNRIKDFFDSQEPPVKYDNKAKIEELKVQFAEHFNYDIVKLQEIFS